MPQAMALWKYCFRDSDEFTKWYFERRAGDVLALADGELIAQQVIVPIPFSIRGERRAGCIVSGVATRPEYRGQGLMGSLMEQGLAYLRERGNAFAALYPSSYDFYRRYGWEQASDALRIRAPVGKLPAARMSGRFDLVDASRYAERARDFSDVYERCYQGFSGRVTRDAGAFALRLEELAIDGGHAALYLREGAIEGYLLYRIEGRRFIAEEFGAASVLARRDLLTYISGHASTVDEVSLTSPADDATWRLIPDARGIATLEPYAMFRVLDIRAALRGLSAGAGEVILKIEDRCAPWNEGTWRFYSAGSEPSAPGKLTVEQVADCGAPVLPVGALVQWAIGYLDGSGLRGRMPGLQPETAAQMDALLPKKPVFLYEMY